MPTGTQPRAFAEHGRRDTRQRRALREHLEGSDSFLSAQQLYDELRTGGDRVGLATVYRTLQAMAEAGEVDVLHHEGETLYRKCGARHHHHLVCRNCGVAVEIDGPTVERWAAKTADQHGFTEIAHIVEIFGLCASCAESSG